MDNELKQYLVGMEARIGDRVGKIVIDAVAESEQHTKEALYDLETKLISEFWKWGRTAESKLKVIPIFEERLSALESRLFSVEEKVSNIQHPPRGN